MADEKAQGSQGFWTSMPGMMAALAAIITASAGLLTALKPSDKSTAAPSDGTVRTPAVGSSSGARLAQAKTVDVTPPVKDNANGQAASPSDFDIVSVTPNVASPLPLGRPIELAVLFRYKPAAPPEARFGVYLEEFPPGDPTCSGNVHHNYGGKLVPAKSETGEFHAIVKWQRKAGDTYKSGGAADHGFLSVGSNLWQDGSGRAGTLVRAFGTSPATCIPYG